MKQLKDETRADLSALEKEELNRKSNHQGLMKGKTVKISVLSKAAQDKEILGFKLGQSAKEAVEVWRRPLKHVKLPKLPMWLNKG